MVKKSLCIGNCGHVIMAFVCVRRNMYVELKEVFTSNGKQNDARKDYKHICGLVSNTVSILLFRPLIMR